jgi:hypothetical protein
MEIVVSSPTPHFFWKFWVARGGGKIFPILIERERVIESQVKVKLKSGTTASKLEVAPISFSVS